MSAPLLSRFDLVFILLDRPNEVPILTVLCNFIGFNVYNIVIIVLLYFEAFGCDALRTCARSALGGEAQSIWECVKHHGVLFRIKNRRYAIKVMYLITHSGNSISV